MISDLLQICPRAASSESGLQRTWQTPSTLPGLALRSLVGTVGSFPKIRAPSWVVGGGGAITRIRIVLGSNLDSRFM